MNIRNEVNEIKDQIISWRRYFHEYPELSFKEFNTAEKINSELKSMGLKPKTKVGRTGVTVDLRFGEGPVIGFRADMDALPIQETSGLPFTSKRFSKNLEKNSKVWSRWILQWYCCTTNCSRNETRERAYH